MQTAVAIPVIVAIAALTTGCGRSMPFVAVDPDLLQQQQLTSNLRAGPQFAGSGFTIATTLADGPVEGVPVVGDPMLVPHTRTLVVPFVIQSDKGLFDDDDPYTRRGGSSTDAAYQWIDRRDRPEGPRLRILRQPTRWHNALFRDLDTNESWTLLDERGVVSLIQSVPDIPETDPDEGLIAFVATINDTNGDGKLNNADARVLILTDGDGRHPRIVSPRDAQLLSFTYDANADALWLDVVHDTDGDGRFVAGDDRLPYLCRPQTDQTASPVIALETIDRARALLAADGQISTAE